MYERAKRDANLFIIEFTHNIIEFLIILSTFPHILSTSPLLLSTSEKATRTDILAMLHTNKKTNPPSQGSVFPEDHYVPSTLFYNRFEGFHFEIRFPC